MILLRHRSLALAAAGVLSMLLAACATDSNGAVVTRSGSRGFTADTPVSTSPAGTPRSAGSVGSSMGSNGLGGGRGSF